jgi:aminoglycoside 6'-N-acetyltransferase I
MNATIRVEKIEIESLDPALHLLGRFFDEEGFSTPADEMRASLHTMVTGPGSAVFLAWQWAKAVGVATVTTSVGIEYGRAAELEDLYVLPAARRSGVAGALIDAVRVWCRAQGCTTLLVTVTREGEAAHKLMDFYQRRGFVNTGRVILEQRLRRDE